MQRSDYLRLRDDQLSLAHGVRAWDTAPLAALKVRETELASQLSHDQERHRQRSPHRAGLEAELALLARNTSRLLLYLRAVCYLREHGIAPDWPQGSVAMVPPAPTP